ncbi:MAG: flagellar hook-basal body complex protein FliE [ANME-2 cluster archaeon]|nr:flagellar hook-basal body complex protein FliE [ANME-2 cluster archaeon]
MKIIAFVGMPASGKGEAAKVAKDMGYPVVNMGNAIREEIERLGLEPTDENLGMTGTKLRQEEGPSAIARRCVPKLRAINVDTAVVDGVRNIEEVHLFKEEFGDDFLLINIDSSTQNRLHRIQMRGRSDDRLMNEEALRTRDERELGWGMAESIKSADMTIENNGSLEEFRDKVSKVIGENK